MEAFPAIFLITDDAVLADAIPAQLQHALGATVQQATTLEAAIPHFSPSPPAMVMVDLATSDITEETVLSLRRDHPLMGLVLVGTPHSTQADEQTFSSLPLTAYAARPLAIRPLIRSLEYLAYARKVSAGGQALPLDEKICFLPAQNRLEWDGHDAIDLTDKEGAVLLCLYHHRHAAVPRQLLLEEVWGYGEGIDTHTLETHLYRLRQKLKAIPGGEDWIRSHQGTYRLHVS